MEGFAARLRKAFRAYEDRIGRDLTQTELGVLVGKELGEDPITQQSVARWFSGTLPEHARMVALAKVLGVDPGWLSYGSGEDEGGEGVKTAPPVPTPAPTKRTPPPLQQPEVLETHWIRPTGKKKAKRRRDDRSAIAS